MTSDDLTAAQLSEGRRYNAFVLDAACVAPARRREDARRCDGRFAATVAVRGGNLDRGRVQVRFPATRLNLCSVHVSC